MAIELSPALATSSFDPVFFILSIPIALALLALLWAVLRRRLRPPKPSAPRSDPPTPAPPSASDAPSPSAPRDSSYL